MAKTNKLIIIIIIIINKSRPKHRDSGDTPKGQTSSGSVGYKLNCNRKLVTGSAGTKL